MSGDLIVICNAGPLMALGKLNRLDLLSALYSQVTMPDSVYAEVVTRGLTRGEPDARIVRQFWQQQKWPVVPVSDGLLRTYSSSVILGQGERAVLALALANAHSLALLDDEIARSEARRLGLRAYGTLGVLVEAYRREQLSFAQFELLLLEIAARPDIWISARLCQEVLAQLSVSGP